MPSDRKASQKKKPSFKKLILAAKKAADESGDPARALALCERALSGKAPAKEETLYTGLVILGTSATALGRYDRAATAIDRATNLFPDKLRAWAARVDLNRAMQDAPLDARIRDMSKYHSLTARKGGERHGRATVWLCADLLEAGDTEKAAAVLASNPRVEVNDEADEQRLALYKGLISLWSHEQKRAETEAASIETARRRSADGAALTQEQESQVRNKVAEKFRKQTSLDVVLSETVARVRPELLPSTERARLESLHRTLIVRCLDRKEMKKAAQESTRMHIAHPTAAFPLQIAARLRGGAEQGAPTAKLKKRQRRDLVRIAHTFPTHPSAWRAIANEIPTLQAETASALRRRRCVPDISSDADATNSRYTQTVEAVMATPGALSVASSSTAAVARAMVSSKRLLSRHASPLKGAFNNTDDSTFVQACEIAAAACHAGIAIASQAPPGEAETVAKSGLRMWAALSPQAQARSVELKQSLQLALADVAAGARARAKSMQVFLRLGGKEAATLAVQMRARQSRARTLLQSLVAAAARPGSVSPEDMQRMVNEAIETCKTQISASPESDWPYALQARALRYSTPPVSIARRENLIKTALILDPFQPAHYLSLGLLYREAGGALWTNKDKAFRCLLSALKLDPTLAEAFALLGANYETVSGDEDRAVRCYKKSLALSPGNQTAGQAMARIYRSNGQFALEEEVLDNAVRNDPAARWAWVYGARVAAASSRLRRAVGAFQSSLRIDPRDASVWEELGQAYRELGKHAAAAKSFEKSLDLTPDDSKQGSAQSRLSRLARAYQLADVRLELEDTEGAVSLLRPVFDSICTWETTIEPPANPPAWIVVCTGALYSKALLQQAERLYASGAVTAASVALSDADHALDVVGARIKDTKGGGGTQSSCLQPACLWRTRAEVLALRSELPPPKGEECKGSTEEEGIGRSARLLARAMQAMDMAMQQRPSDFTLLFTKASMCVQAIFAAAEHPADGATQQPRAEKLRLEAVSLLHRAMRSGGSRDPRVWALLSTSLGLGKSDDENMAMRVVASQQHLLLSALDLSPRAAEPWTMLGLLYMSQQELGLAASALVRGQTADPECEQLWLARGLLYLACMSEDAPAEKRFETLALAKTAFETATEGSASKLGWFGAALVGYSMHKLRVARAARDGALPIDNRTPELYSALDSSSRLVAALPDSPAALNLRGCILESVGDAESAIVVLRQALDALGEQAESVVGAMIRANLARSLSRLGAHDDAEQAITTAFANIDDKKKTAPVGLTRMLARTSALVAMRRGDGKAAIASCKADIEASSSAIGSPETLAYLARAQQLAGDRKQAFDTLSAAHTRHPKSTLILKELFALHLQAVLAPGSTAADRNVADNLAKTAVANMAAAEGPPYADSLECKFWLHIARGQNSGARRALTKLTHAFPAKSGLWNRLAALHLARQPGQAPLWLATQCLEGPAFRAGVDSAGGSATDLAPPSDYDGSARSANERQRLYGEARLGAADPKTTAIFASSVHADPTRPGGWFALASAAALRAMADGTQERLLDTVEFLLQHRLPGILSEREIVTVRVLASRCLLIAGRVDRAKSVLDAAERTVKDMKTNDANLLKAIAHERARATLLEIDEKRSTPDQAIAAYKTAIELDPTDAFLWEEMSDVYLAFGAPAAAQACLDAGLAMTMQAVTGAAMLQAQCRIHLRIACLCYFTRRYVAGTKAAQQACDAMPDSPGAAFLLGLFLRKARKYDEAYEAFCAALRLSAVRQRGGACVFGAPLAGTAVGPKQTEMQLANLNVFQVLFKKKAFSEAFHALQREALTNPTLAAVQYQMGVLAEKAAKAAAKKKQKPDGGGPVPGKLPRRHYATAIFLNPTSPSYWKALEKARKK